MDLKTSLIFLVAVLVFHCAEARSLHKRAAFYIANETACVVDNIVYYNGDPIPTDDPCEACKCRPPGFACVLRECEVKPGCRAVRRTGHCCPDYVCGCEHNGRMYRDGDEIRDSQNPCYTCHCQGSAIACAFVDCFFRVDCAPDYVQGECCPRYDHCQSLEPQTNVSYPGISDAAVPTIFSTSKPFESTTFTAEPYSSSAATTPQDIVNSESTSEKVVVVSSSEVQTGAPQIDDALGNINGDPTSLFYIPREDSNKEVTNTVLPTIQDDKTDLPLTVTYEISSSSQSDISLEKTTTEFSKSSDSPTTDRETTSEKNELTSTNAPLKDVEFFAPSEIQGSPDKSKDNLVSTLATDTQPPNDSSVTKEVIVVTTLSAENEPKSSKVVEEPTTEVNKIDQTSDLAITSTFVPLPVFLNKDNLQEEKSVNAEEKPLQVVNTETNVETTTKSAGISEEIASTTQRIDTTSGASKSETLLKSEILDAAERTNSNDNTVDQTTLKLDTIKVSVTTTTSRVADVAEKATTNMQSEDYSTDQQTKATKISELEVPTTEVVRADITTTDESQPSTPVPTLNESNTELPTA